MSQFALLVGSISDWLRTHTNTEAEQRRQQNQQPFIMIGPTRVCKCFALFSAELLLLSGCMQTKFQKAEQLFLDQLRTNKFEANSTTSNYWLDLVSMLEPVVVVGEQCQ